MATLNQPTNRKQQLAALLRRRIPEKPVEFIPGDVVTPPDQVVIRYPGALLDVPLNQSAVVQAPSGTIVNYRAGEHFLEQFLNGSMAPYTIRFYDLSQQISVLQDIVSASSDAWEVAISNPEFHWKVVDPLGIKDMPHPRRVVESTCCSTVIDYIRTMQHDRLMSMPGQTPLSTAEMAAQLTQVLNAHPSLKGIEITRVLILGVKGDRRRTDSEPRESGQKKQSPGLSRQRSST